MVTVVEIPETPAVAVSVPPKVQVKLGCWELFKVGIYNLSLTITGGTVYSI